MLSMGASKICIGFSNMEVEMIDVEVHIHKKQQNANYHSSLENKKKGLKRWWKSFSDEWEHS